MIVLSFPLALSPFSQSVDAKQRFNTERVELKNKQKKNENEKTNLGIGESGKR